MTEALEPAQWLAMAADDLAAGRALALQPSGYPDKVCFFAQQCAERALKGVIIYLGADMPRTHILKELWAVLRAQGAPPSPEVEAALMLTPYATETRYAGLDTLDRAEAARALALAAPVLAWARGLVSRAR